MLGARRLIPLCFTSITRSTLSTKSDTMVTVLRSLACERSKKNMLYFSANAFPYCIRSDSAAESEDSFKQMSAAINGALLSSFTYSYTVFT